MKILNRRRQRRGNERRRGSVTIVALVVVVVLMLLCGAMLTSALQGKNERSSAVERHRADFTADAGIAHAVTNLTGNDDSDIGDVDTPLVFGGGTYWATVDDNGDGSYTVTSTGTNGNELSRLEALLEPIGGGIYDNAVFAGNSSGDPDYELRLGGLGGQADEVDGDIYSGGDVEVWGDADIGGTIRAGGEIVGATGEEDISQHIPDLGAMNYAATADFDVAQMFDDDGQYRWNNAGGSAYQLPESSPGHIFRMNPSDRTTNTNATEKDDFFLEDPYETVRSDSGQDGSNAYRFSPSGVSGEPGVDSNQKVFYIDGNLWLHNRRSYSLGMAHSEADGVQITVVVKGNIYFADNFFYQDDDKDGIAFIAMTDDDVDDSGNIYFGDPVYGTLQEMHAFMYAENNFYDTNLDASGSSEVYLNGNMTAGNQVLIERDYDDHHTKLTVDFDDRISVGDLSMPGLPGNSGVGPDRFLVTYWRQLPDRVQDDGGVIEIQ